MVDPFAEPCGLLIIAAADIHNRFRFVASKIVGKRILDVGSGGKSLFTLRWPDCISVDPVKKAGVDVLASAAHLPFKSGSFDTVVCVDTLEHIPRPLRINALSETRRVASKRVVIHAPVQDGLTFLGRSGDLALGTWYDQLRKRRPESLREHIRNVEPSRKELEDAGFELTGTQNVGNWLYCMRLASFKWPIGALASQSYYLTHRSQRSHPPFWGAVAIFDKSTRKKGGPTAEVCS